MGILDLFFPVSCLTCGKYGKYICEVCLAKVRTPTPICPQCFRWSHKGKVHAKCETKDLDSLISVWKYEDIVKKAIVALKYKYAAKISEELGSSAADALSKTSFSLPKKPVLVPIPLYWLRKNQRGFNQSEEVGRLISEKMGWEFNPELLVKNRRTKFQAELSKEERLKNIKKAFFLNQKYINTPIPSNIVLFDDVWTTGATLKEAARVLKKGGAGKVWGLTIARG